MNNENEEITWIIDRIGDTNLLSFYYNIETYFDEYDELEYINSISRNNKIIELPKLPKVIVNETMQISLEHRECCICMQEKEKSDICCLDCKHTFCVFCIKNMMEILNKYRKDIILCPLCRGKIEEIYVISNIIREKIIN